MTAVIYILSFLVLLGVLVTIHEFGHFIVARMCNVYVQSFSIGMGPVIYKKLDKQGTEFRISAFLLGGYVSMITNKLIDSNIRAVLDDRSDKIGAKIRNAEIKRTNVMLIVGPKEAENNTVSVRRKFAGDLGTIDQDMLISYLLNEIKDRSLTHS